MLVFIWHAVTAAITVKTQPFLTFDRRIQKSHPHKSSPEISTFIEHRVLSDAGRAIESKVVLKRDFFRS